jgi:hypothetical protein
MGHVVDAVERHYEIEPVGGRNFLGSHLFKGETIRHSRSCSFRTRPRD